MKTCSLCFEILLTRSRSEIFLFPSH